jgi:hypothetical protein
MNFSPTVTVQLRNSTTPYALVDQETGTLSTAGVGSFQFLGTTNGSSYFIVVKSWNTIETWSATAQTVASNSLTYDFTSAQAQAYSSNMKLAGTGTKWCLFSGDVNQDGYINGGDFNTVNNDAYNHVTGSVVTDLTGDLFTNGADFNVVNNNAYNHVTVHTPLLNPSEFNATSIARPIPKKVITNNIQ